MRARRVATVRALGHVIQIGVQLRDEGTWAWPANSRPLWKVAHLVEDHAPVQQCWSDLVDWVFGSGWDDRTLRSMLPWRPVTQTCRDDAARVGACYCGKVASAPCAAGPSGQRRRQRLVAAASLSSVTTTEDAEDTELASHQTPSCRDCDCPMDVHNAPEFGGGCEVCGVECEGWR